LFALLKTRRRSETEEDREGVGTNEFTDRCVPAECNEIHSSAPAYAVALEALGDIACPGFNVL
jgi:hypothetical protein